MKPVSLVRPIRLLLLVGAAGSVVWVARHYSTWRIPDADQSLLPVYPGGTRVLAADLSFRDPLPRGSDVVYEMEQEGRTYARFGRVAAVAGDEIGEQGGRLTVNGTPLPFAGAAAGKVPEEALFILVTNPFEGRYPDSRSLGFIQRKQVRARILARISMGH